MHCGETLSRLDIALLPFLFGLVIGQPEEDTARQEFPYVVCQIWCVLIWQAQLGLRLASRAPIPGKDYAVAPQREES